MRDLLFPSPAERTVRVRRAAVATGRVFAEECRALHALWAESEPEHREFVDGEVACLLHLSPAAASARLLTALQVVGQPVVLAALEAGRIGVGHALAALNEVDHLDDPHAARILDAVLSDPSGDDEHGLPLTPGELRSAVKRQIQLVDADLARQRHEKAKKTADVHARPTRDGMGQIVIDLPATDMATAIAAIHGRAAAMTFDTGPDGQPLTAGQQRVAALLHALRCERTHVQAVIECPVEAAVDLHAAARSGVWTVDLRLPLAVALGLSDHPALLNGYGPISADQARALLPTADLVKACVDATTGEVLAVERPVRQQTWTKGDPDQARALRHALLQMTTVSTRPDLTEPGYVPSTALGRLVDLRDVTSTFPGDATPARKTDRDHRLPWPLGPTSPENLQNLPRRWHRAKQNGWTTTLEPDGTLTWTSPNRGIYRRRPQRTPPPPIDPDTTLPPLS